MSAKTKSKTNLPPPGTKRMRPVVTVAMRQQTPEEQRQFQAVIELLVAELVRQNLDRENIQ